MSAPTSCVTRSVCIFIFWRVAGMASHMAKVGPHKWCATLIYSTVSTTGTNPAQSSCVHGHVQAFMCKVCCARSSAKHARVARMRVMHATHALKITNHVKWPHRWPSSEIPETNATPPHSQHAIRVQTIGTRACTHVCSHGVCECCAS
jgi:hypothetical protein